MTETQKKRMLNHDDLDIVLADLDKILYLNDDDVLYIYEGDDYFVGYDDKEKKTYEAPLFSIGASEIKLGSFLSPRFALAKVWHVEHCDDGIFRSVRPKTLARTSRRRKLMRRRDRDDGQGKYWPRSETGGIDSAQNETGVI